MREPHELNEFFDAVACVIPLHPATKTIADEDDQLEEDTDSPGLEDDDHANADMQPVDDSCAPDNEEDAALTQRQKRAAARSATQPKGKKRQKKQKPEIQISDSAKSGSTKVRYQRTVYSHAS